MAQKREINWVMVILIIIFLWFLFSDNTYVEQPQPVEEQTAQVNSGNGTYTVMIYMCGSDLEQNYGSASSDIKEMLNANIDEKINVIIETGGTNRWHNYNISGESNQIYKIENNELTLLKDLGKVEMVNSKALSDFIKYSKENYPADKYGLILWDHGGGAVSGFGHDLKAKNKEDTLTLDELKKALADSKIDLEFLGFDACLMADIETAIAVKDNAKYLIASEETEPGNGWQYTKIFNELSTNSSQSGEDIGKTIVDSFIASNNTFFSFSDATLSVIDLSKVDGLYDVLCEFLSEIENNNLKSKKFNELSRAVNNTKAFADGELDLIDIKDFSINVNNAKSKDIQTKIDEAVVYYKNTDMVSNTYGLAMFMPYKTLGYYNKMLTIYNKIGMGEKYTAPLTKYVTVLGGGRIDNYTINNHSYEIDNSYKEEDWYDEDEVENYQSLYQETKIEQTKLNVIDKGEYYALRLDDKDKENITNITIEVLYDDGDGYVDLGSDDFAEYDEDGDLKVTYDGEWIAINGQYVPFYVTESNDDYVLGEVQAYVNEERVYIYLYWSEEYPDGIVLGYNNLEQYGNTTIRPKGMAEFNEGDKIKFEFDFYKYNGEFDGNYFIGKTITVGKDDLKVSYEPIEDVEFYIYYKITDIYNNTYFTEPVVIY